MFLTWRLLAARRLWLLPVLLLLFPVLDALRLGQVVILVVAIVTLAWWLSEHGHGFSAGTILALATLKPQLILLLPPVLLLTHHRREFLGFVAGSTAIGLLSFALVGTKGIAAMLANQQDTLSNPAQFHIDNSMVLRLWWPGTPGLLLVIAVLILTLGLAWRHRASPPSAIYAIGILGSLLVAPYFHVQDLVLWIPAALLMQRSVGLPRPVAVLGLIFASLPIFGAPLVTLLALLFFFRPVLLHPEATNNPIRPTPSLVGVQQPI
jgi:hypothetical protein